MPPFPSHTYNRRDEILRQIRAGRFADAVVCPRCMARKVCRWGQFSGRQRYRCAKCRRTFSDLTATPAAYSKKIELWPHYARCMGASWSIRRAAAQLHIHPSTSFRWRHALLNELRRLDSIALQGIVEIHYMRFLHSMKGARNLNRPARRRGMQHDLRFCLKSHCVTVTVARDRRANVFTMLSGTPRATLLDLKTRLVPRFLKATTLVGESGVISPAAIAARSARIAYVRVWPGIGDGQQPRHHTNNVRTYIRQMRRWFLRFRGVATRYLENYLIWHREVCRGCLVSAIAAFLRWPLRRASSRAMKPRLHRTR